MGPLEKRHEGEEGAKELHVLGRREWSCRGLLGSLTACALVRLVGGGVGRLNGRRETRSGIQGEKAFAVGQTKF